MFPLPLSRAPWPLSPARCRFNYGFRPCDFAEKSLSAETCRERGSRGARNMYFIIPFAFIPHNKKGGTTSYFTNWRAWMKRPQLRPRRRALKVESSAVHTAPLWTRGHTGWSPSTSRPFQWEMRHTRTIEGPTLSQRPRPFPRCTPQMRTVWSSLADAII